MLEFLLFFSISRFNSIFFLEVVINLQTTQISTVIVEKFTHTTFYVTQI